MINFSHVANMQDMGNNDVCWTPSCLLTLFCHSNKIKEDKYKKNVFPLHFHCKGNLETQTKKCEWGPGLHYKNT